MARLSFAILSLFAAVGVASAIVADRPAFHYAPAKGWVNDPMLFQYNGTYHLITDCNPVSTAAPWAPNGTASNCHATSQDLVSWQQQPVALRAGHGTGNFLAAPAKSALPSDIVVVGMLSGGFLVGFNSSFDALVPLANASVIPKPPGGSIVGDVFMLPEPAGGNSSGYRAVISGSTGDGFKTGAPLLLNYASSDLVHWTFSSVLFEGSSDCGPRAECANYFELDGAMVLLVSCPSKGHTMWYIGTENATKGFVPSASGIIDNGDAYAASTALDEDNRRLIMLWARDGLTPTDQQASGYANWESLPRELSIDGNGYLASKPIEDLLLYADPIIQLHNVHVDDGVYQVSLPAGLERQFLIQVSIQAGGGAGSWVGVDFLRAPDGSELTSVGSPISQSACNFTTAKDVDHMGGDITRVPLSGANATVSNCEQVCCETKDCVGFVYHITGTDQADCFPKEKIMPAAPLKDAVSGYFSRNLVVNTSMSSTLASAEKRVVNLALPTSNAGVTFTAIVDHTVLEVFGGDTNSATTLPVHPQNPLSTGFQLRSDGGTATFNVDIYPLRVKA